MSLFLIIGIAIVGILLLGAFWGILTDPARIDEEEDTEVAHETPAERHGFLRSHRHTGDDWSDRIAEQSKTDYDADSQDINDL